MIISKLNEVVRSQIETKFGLFNFIAFSEDESNYVPHFAICHPQMDIDDIVVIRIHSECITGDLFHSMRCDCGEQLEASLNYINETKGCLLYLRQEGRGIGIINKLKAYNLQDTGKDTVEANLELGFLDDQRDFGIAIEILHHLNIKRIKLLTNNPKKINIFDTSDITLIERLALEIPSHHVNRDYLNTKKHKMGHLLDNL